MGNLARSLLKAVFKLTSQLLYWAMVLLYQSLGISNSKILMPLKFSNAAGHSKLALESESLLSVGESLSLLSNLLFYPSSSSEVLRCSIS